VLPGDLAIYFSEAGDPNHSGVVVEGAGSLIEIRICSKWAYAGEFVHGPRDCPEDYGPQLRLPTLYRSLARSAVVERLRVEVPLQKLASYFTYLTARPRQSAVKVALAYGLLAAILRQNSTTAVVGVPRLEWGSYFVEYSKNQASLTVLTLSAPTATVLEQFQTTGLPRGLWSAAGTPIRINEE
jgi:hypothetical protein